MFYYNQNEFAKIDYSKPNGEKKNIATSGCGVCSTAMAINNLFRKEIYTIPKLAEYSKKNGFRLLDGTDVIGLCKSLSKLHPDFKVKTSIYGKDLIAHLKTGGVAIVNQSVSSYPLLSTGGHFCYVYKAEGNNVYVADPAYTSTRYKTDFRKKHIIKETSNGCVVSIDTLNKCSDRDYILLSYTGKKAEPKSEPKAKPLCNLIKANATVTKGSTVYHDNEKTIKTGYVDAGERVRVAIKGATWSVVQYSITAKHYAVGLISTKNIKFD